MSELSYQIIIDEIRAWVTAQNEYEMCHEVTCPDCGDVWMWAHDMPDMPYAPKEFSEAARCPACKDADGELIARLPLAGVVLPDLSLPQLPAVTPSTARYEHRQELRKWARSHKSRVHHYPIVHETYRLPAHCASSRPVVLPTIKRPRVRSTTKRGTLAKGPKGNVIKWSEDALRTAAHAAETLDEWFPRKTCPICGKVHANETEICAYCQDVVGNRTVTEYHNDLMGEF